MANSRLNKQRHTQWLEFLDNIRKSTPVDLNETKFEQQKRIKKLESSFENWAKYYFPNYYSSEPAPFHKSASKRVINNPEYYEVRPWARELAKSARTMMEVMYLILTEKKKNVLMVSATSDDAERLLKPYRGALEANNRIIHDYGEQRSLRKWESGEFVTKKAAAFRAIGAGQSPRGTRNEEFRPDIILIDDIDTDEECRNKDRVKNKIKWIEEALIPTRSVSGELLIVVCGNIIAKYSVITELMKKADYCRVINIRDSKGKSTWPTKNKEKDIDRVLGQISYNSGQKEYFNNPQSEGDVFKDINFGKVPSIRSCDDVLVYADPATSNKDKSNASTKAVAVIGYKDLTYYIYKIWVGGTSNAGFVNWLFEAHNYLVVKRVDIPRIWIENNSLQDPFYEQVILPLIYQNSKQLGFSLPITPDERKKPEKFFRIEGTLEPLHRLGRIVFDEKMKGTTFMETFKDQWLGVSATSKLMDGPDCIEGGIHLIQQRVVSRENTYIVPPSINRKY